MKQGRLRPLDFEERVVDMQISNDCVPFHPKQGRESPRIHPVRRGTAKNGVSILQTPANTTVV